MAYVAKNASAETLTVMGAVLLVPAIAFLYLYVSGSRTTGAEVFGDKIWWNDLRPVHAFLYAAFAFSAFVGHTETAWMFLFVDVLFGLASFLAHHYLDFLPTE